MATNEMTKVEIQNVNHPGHVTLVDADMYEAMKTGLSEDSPDDIARTD